MTDWRKPELRRDVFLDSWEFHLQFGTLPGLVHLYLPAIAEEYNLDEEGKAWLIWLNANTQNPAMSLLLLEESGASINRWDDAFRLWEKYYALMDWDTDRRHQKSRFGEATLKFIADRQNGYANWESNGMMGWGTTWNYALGLPYLGRLSAWSMIEYARILYGPGVVPDADDLMLRDLSGSRSHRNGLAVVAGYEGAEYWGPSSYFWNSNPGLIESLNDLGESLLSEMKERRPEASRLDLESALCTYKGWHKPNRRYPNVYADMAYQRLIRAESRFGQQFSVLWKAREKLPAWARLECTPNDPGLCPKKQNLYRETGEIPMMGHVWPKYWSSFDEEVHGDRTDAS